MDHIDLNCDLGESFGAYAIGLDDEVMPLITSANIACGWHAGDPLIMEKTVKTAIQHGVSLGAHPGFPDLMGFGRRPMHCDTKEIRAYVIYQVAALMGFCRVNNAELRHVKPHGALYNMAVADERIFTAIAQAVAAVNPNLLLVTLAGKDAEKRCRIGRKVGINVVLEAFADRAYTHEGVLVPRSRPEAVITDPAIAAKRVVEIIKKGRVKAVDGSFVPLTAQTICVHGDSPDALKMIQQIRRVLPTEKIQLSPMEL